MADPLDRLPSEVELLAAEHPAAEVWREVRADGTHGDWVAELHLRLQSPTPGALGGLLAWVMAALRCPPGEPGGTVAWRSSLTDTPGAAVPAFADRGVQMMAPADSGRANAELDRTLVDLWGALEEVQLKLVDLLGRGSLFEGRDNLRARLSKYGRVLTSVQGGLRELRRGGDQQSQSQRQGAEDRTEQQAEDRTEDRAANGAASG